jgi:hypothetical protein
MPLPLVWTDAQDTQLRRLRAESVEWPDIARVLGRSRWAVMMRARQIGARRPPAEPAPVPAPATDDREPLPAGHPTSWGPLLAGTLLEGSEYPLPFFYR